MDADGDVSFLQYKADILCIPHQQYREARGRYEEHGIKPGTWSFRLRAVSLAGNGPWTEVQQFYVAPIGKCVLRGVQSF